MKTILLLSFLMLHFGLFAQREFEMKEGDTTFIMKQYFFCMLKKGYNADKIDSVTLQKIQAAHLGHINKMAEAGKLHIAGPMGDDGNLRGILILDVETLHEADSMVSLDPAVKAGRLSYEIHPWWGAKGSTLK